MVHDEPHNHVMIKFIQRATGEESQVGRQQQQQQQHPGGYQGYNFPVMDKQGT